MSERIIYGMEEDGKKPKNRDLALRNVFFILALIVLLAGIALGIYFGYGEFQGIGFNRLPITRTGFELWRAFIFWFTGLSSALCLFSVSLVFGRLAKKYTTK